MRGCSSLGRAPEWHSGGKGFDPPHLHQRNYHLLIKRILSVDGFFYARKARKNGALGNFEDSAFDAAPDNFGVGGGSDPVSRVVVPKLSWRI
jgi:hypothetical protein